MLGVPNLLLVLHEIRALIVIVTILVQYGVKSILNLFHFVHIVRLELTLPLCLEAIMLATTAYERV